MATFNKFNQFVEDVAEKVHNLGSDTLKIMLTNTAPNATDAPLSQITEISAGNGYTAGGSQATQTSSAQSSGTYKLVCSDVTFTASGETAAAVGTSGVDSFWDAQAASTIDIDNTRTINTENG